MNDTIEFSPEAASGIDDLYRTDKRLFARVVKKIESLQGNPRAGKTLIGYYAGNFSLQVGNYRIVYELSAGAVSILTIRPNRQVY